MYLYSVGIRNRVIVQFDSGLKALRVEELEVCPGSEFTVDNFPHFTDDMLDLWSSLINSTITATTVPHVADTGKCATTAPHVADTGEYITISPRITDTGKCITTALHVADTGKFASIVGHLLVLCW